MHAVAHEVQHDAFVVGEVITQARIPGVVEHGPRVSQSYGDATDLERGDVRAAVATGINEADPLSMLELRDDWPDPSKVIVQMGGS
jgi:hypothetical protein